MNRICPNICKVELYFNFIKSNLHTTGPQQAWAKSDLPKSFLTFNKKIYPPQQIGEEPRPAFVCHQKTNIKYSPEKLWYVASLVRGMTVDEAVKQLSFVNKKGAVYVKEAILEAQKLAVSEHNVEFKSNLWIAESFSGKGMVVKGIRRHARGRIGEVRYQYSHYFVRLEEGKPPQDYYKRNPLTPQQQLEKWMESMRKRKITNSY
ncbi:39S ribosomal protein L22, mitochondrial [Nymphalis io]|uniref:39S ribosomal protein L22, mitochondrial n=1 Tax=Inachis io TaxID=171585 RepID=UPI0021687D3B|nr:39S ribosomal protein L22, mitochondrial [Nymphalis io]